MLVEEVTSTRELEFVWEFRNVKRQKGMFREPVAIGISAYLRNRKIGKSAPQKAMGEWCKKKIEKARPYLVW